MHNLYFPIFFATVYFSTVSFLIHFLLGLNYPCILYLLYMLLVLRQQSVNNFVQDSCETSSAAPRVTSDQEQTETLARMDGEREDMREKKENQQKILSCLVPQIEGSLLSVHQRIFSVQQKVKHQQGKMDFSYKG